MHSWVSATENAKARTELLTIAQQTRRQRHLHFEAEGILPLSERPNLRQDKHDGASEDE